MVYLLVWVKSAYIESCLNGNLPNGDNGGLESHREADPTVGCQIAERGAPICPLDARDRQLDEHKNQAADRRHDLRNNGCNRSSSHTHAGVADQHVIQNHVDYARDRQKDQRRAAVPQRPQDIAEKIEKHCHYRARENDGQVCVGIIQNLLRCIQQP